MESRHVTRDGRREDGGRGLKSFREVYNETKVRVACYMATSNNGWIKVLWRNEYMKEQASLKIVAEEVIRSVNAQVEFNAGEIKIGNEKYMDWKVAWKKLKNMVREGQIKDKFESLAEKRMQSEIPLGFDKDDHIWLKCNTDPRKTASIFTLQDR